MQFHLIRHAQSMNNAHEGDPTYQHIEDAPITQLGYTQANHLATFLRQQRDDDHLQALRKSHPKLPIVHLDALYCSPMQRALQTTKPIAATLDLAPTVLIDTYEHGGVYRREGSPGAYTRRGFPGLNRQQMQAIIPNVVLPDDVTANGWWTHDFEPNDAFSARIKRVADFLRRQARHEWADRSVGLVAHADFSNLLIKTILTGDVPEFRREIETSFIYPYNTSITRIDFSSEGFPVVRYISRVAHLPYEMITQ